MGCHCYPKYGILAKEDERYQVIDNNTLNNLVLSSTNLNPGHSTSGHKHKGQEEVYIFVKGSDKSLGADCIKKKLENKHIEKISTLLKKSEIKDIKPDSFKRYGSARKLYNFNIDNVSKY